ncbi:putative patatin-like phospholipase domain-containing protein 1 [Iris pallida]|uniref:Patatin n=1 Tax=Iris pallida TaxID=29817 RepID=A0AAX6EZL7_IRIPA|nr:putative patatin-like phospholipase domain-containing protein 1 [Iris pallida]
MSPKKLLPSARHSFYMASLSSSFLHQPLFFPNPNPRFPIFQTRTLGFVARADRDAAEKTDKPPTPAADAEKKSLSVAAGEIFLGLASLLVRTAGGAKRRKSGGSAAGEGGEEEEEAANVVEDRGVIWEQREEDVEAEMERKELTSPGFSFSAAGLLFPYHLGVSQLLLEKGYIKETTPLAGSSAGAIVCATIASGNTMEEALQATKILAEDCRLNGTAFRLGAVLRNLLDVFLPDDVHTKCNGRVRVAITQLLWRPRGLLVDQFDSKEDLINAVITSSFIPGYLAPRPATMFRNRLCIDGGLTLFIPPTSASKTVRVCAFPAGRLGLSEIGISPDCNPENRATPRQLFNWALEPAEDQILDRLYELGYLDAAVWADQNPPLSSTVSEDSPDTRD